VLGPLEFVAYTEDSSDVVAKQDISEHAYADESTTYSHVPTVFQATSLVLDRVYPNALPTS